MKVRSPINIHAKSKVDRSTHNENLGEGSNDLPILGLFVWLKGFGLEGLRYKPTYPVVRARTRRDAGIDEE